MRENLIDGQITERQAVKEMLRVIGMTQKELSEKMGRKPQSVNEQLNDENPKGMRVATLCEILDLMDCEMILRPKKRREGHIDEWKIR